MTSMIDILKEAAEPDFAAFSSKTIPGKDNLIGVRIPTLRKMAKDIIKGDWRAFLEEDTECFEEELLQALVIATAKMDTSERISLTDGFLSVIDNWATCDVFCSSWKFPKKDSAIVWEYFGSLMDSGEEYPMRVSAVFRMDHFIDDEHIDALLEDLETRYHPGYYYRMGSAWALSFCYIHYPKKTRAILESPRLDPWICNKAISKIRDSFRVSKEDKESLKKLRR